MYVHEEPDGTFTLRQIRYRKRLAAGKEHPRYYAECAARGAYKALEAIGYKVGEKPWSRNISSASSKGGNTRGIL